MRLTLRHLEVFRAVMASGHVTRAAELIGSSQPTVSRELARLEQALGYALFDRVRGRLRPTVRAVALMEEVDRAYVGLDRIEATAVALRDLDFAQGRLTLACLPALAHTLLPDAARRFRASHPQAGLSIVPIEPPLLEQSLSEQRHDLGLIEALRAPPGTTLEVLLEADEVAVLPAGHPLLDHRVLKPADFHGLDFVSLGGADPYRRVIDEMFASQRVVRGTHVEAGSAVSVCALVRQGLGVAIVNPLTAMELAGAGLHLRPISVAIPFRVGLVQPEQRPPSPIAPSFVSALRAAARDLKTRLKVLRRG